MITSRLTAFAAAFSILGVTSLTFATATASPAAPPTVVPARAEKPVRVVHLERVVVVAKRSAAEPR